VIAINGDNDYTLPHIGKAHLERLNQLPILIEVSDRALEVAGLRDY
jgi:hypothetical protein